MHEQAAIGVEDEILRRASERSGQPIVQVLWRVRKKSGEWGKPQPAAISPKEVDQLPDEADRSILPLLLGASDSVAVLGGYSSVYSRTSFDLYGELADRVLPLLAKSGRFHLRRVAADATPNVGTTARAARMRATSPSRSSWWIRPR